MILEEIVSKKRQRLKDIKSSKSLQEIKTLALKGGRKPRDFKGAIKRDSGPLRFIGEVKVASPSRGVIREELDISRIAEIYERKVDAISVITEEDFFKGDPSYLASVKELVTKPVLRKDFIIDEYQIYESYLLGADAILLIASILENQLSKELLQIAEELGLAVLFEVHDREELERVLDLGAGIIGINNRNLKTMNIDIRRSLELRPYIPPDRIVVSESGIRTKEDVKLIEDAGIDAILVGTALMEAQDLESMIDYLRS